MHAADLPRLLLLCLGLTPTMPAAAATWRVTTMTTMRRRSVLQLRPRTCLSFTTQSPPSPELRLAPSPVESVSWHGKTVHIKRDDKLNLLGAGIYGNKARKLWSLASTAPPLPSTYLSWGGVQSNAMLALAGLVCGVRKQRFIYCTKRIPQWVKDKPLGNYKRALALGTEIRELGTDQYRTAFGAEEDEEEEGEGKAATMLTLEDLPFVDKEERRSFGETLLVPQGAAMPGAETGLQLLAEEVATWWTAEKATRREKDAHPTTSSLAVVLPAGTGTTALYLTRHLASMAPDVTVYAVPCVGDGAYLQRQMSRLDHRSSKGVGRRVFPHILEGSMPHTFGKPEAELLRLWQQFREEQGLELDLIYGPHAFGRVLSEHWATLWARHDAMLYIHTGGLEGLESQLARYRYLGFLK